MMHTVRVLFLILVILLTFLGLFSYLGIPILHAQIPSSFSRPLRQGMSGADVLELQKILNSDVDTRISSVGPGSPGKESTYFGALTRNAVVRLQEKYSSEVLKPNGLSSGTGYVGVSTLALLNRLNQQAIQLPKGPQTPLSQSSVPSTNPNLKNLDKFLGAIDSVSQKKGISPAQIATIKDRIFKNIATTTDLQATFLKLVEKNNQTAAKSSPNLFTDTWKHIVKAIGTSIFPKAQAQSVGGTPFGGALYFSFYCDCSNSWLLTIQPLAPSYVTLLTYMTGSQAYLSYNIPITTELLGKYSSGGQCEVVDGEGCAEIPSEGQVTPTVGSSI